MAGLQITITDAGRAALPNGPNTGTSAVTISHVGVSPVHTAGSLKGLTVLPGEVKRVTTFGGDIVADDVIHVTINDETTAVYSVRSFGLYLSTGVLFAVFSAPDVVVEKSAGAMVLLSADITFKTLDTAVIQFGGTGFINPPATTERVGVVELATWEEAAAGARADVVVTPFGLLKALQSWATNFAAAVHRHALGDVDGLPEALAGKASAGHRHDAADTTSGTFDVGRIPALAMEKITGLATALAGKAAAIHGHVLSDIDGLVQALNGKSAVGHKHDASDTIGGTFDVGRIPALAMEKITGLATALAAKAALGANVYFALIRIGAGRATLYSDVNTSNLVIRTGPENAERYFVLGDDGSLNAPGPVNSSGGRVWDPSNFDPNSRVPMTRAHNTDPNSAPIGFSSGDANLGNGLQGWHFQTSRRNGSGWGVQTAITDTDTAEQFRFRRSDIDGTWGPWRTVWTTVNFNPGLKADAANPVFYGEYNLASGEVRQRVIGAGGALYLQAGTDASVFGRMRFTGLLGADLSELSVQWGGALRDIYHSGNFNPAGKVNTVNPDNFPHLVNFGWNGDRFVANVDNAVSHALLHMGDATSSLGSSGYAKIPGTGLMIQWGVSTSNIPEGQAHAYLPIAFGGGCLIALANPRNPGSNVNTDYYMQVVSKHLDRIVFYANRANGSSGNVDGFDWIAIGRVSGTPDPAYGSGGGGGGGGGGQVDPYV